MGLSRLRDSEWVRGLTAFLLVLALFTNGLIPVGWMPSQSNGKIGFVICSGSGEASPPFDGVKEHGRNRSPDSDHQATKACAHAGLRLLLNTDAGAPVVRSPAVSPKGASFSTHYATAYARRDGPPIGSRAPPFII